MCISECIQTQNTVRYKQICTSKTGAYLQVCRLEIHSNTCRYAPLHRCISDSIMLYDTAISKHTYTYARDTDHKKTQYILIHSHTCRSRYVHITYAPCISNMHLDVCCAYPCVYVYVLFLHTYHIKRCICCMYVGHICTCRITDVLLLSLHARIPSRIAKFALCPPSPTPPSPQPTILPARVRLARLHALDPSSVDSLAAVKNEPPGSRTPQI